MATFAAAHKRWLEMPFPHGSTNDLVEEYHAELAQWDTFVADIAIPHASSNSAVLPVFDLGAELAGLRSRLTSEHTHLDRDEAEVLTLYRTYVDVLVDVVSTLMDDLGDNDWG